jgi:SYP7 family syntaxin
MSATDINYVLDRLYMMNKYLGGTAEEYDFRSKNMSIYKKLNNDFFKKFQEIKKIQNERNFLKKQTKTSLEILRKNDQIKQGIEFMENVIEQMEKCLAKTPKGDKTKEGEEIIFNCVKLIEQVKKIESYQVSMQKKEEKKINETKKISKFVNNLVGYDVERGLDMEEEPKAKKKKKRVKRPKGEAKVNQKELSEKINQLRNAELSQEEKIALEQWKKIDQQIDKDLDEIDEQMEKINQQLEDFGENMRRNEILIEYIASEAYKVVMDMKTSNAKLKVIMEKFRQPGRMCIEITTAATLSILIGLFVYLLQKYLSL